MKTTKQIRHRKNNLFLSLFLYLFMASISLTACSRQGSLNDGDCKCDVVFTDIPKEFSMLEENLSEHFEIELTLKNTTTETIYEIVLTKENNYSTQVSLPSGTYQVVETNSSMHNYNGITVTANADSVTLSPEVTERISITISDPSAFTEHWMATQPMPEILLADKFSGQIQINRKVISIANIMPELSLSYDTAVKPDEKICLSDLDLGVQVTLVNNSEEEQIWSECEVISITFHNNNVVFPEGITLGMAANEIIHKTEGIYGEPDELSGVPFFEGEIANLSAIYSDPESGDKITITLDSSNSYIESICYEFACSQ